MMTAVMLCLAMCLVVVPRAHAQMTWTNQGFVNLSGGAQTGTHALDTSTTFDLYEEKAAVASGQQVKGGGFFDLSAGYKVWRNLAAAIGYTRSGSQADATITGSIPDPRVFDQPRTITASATGLHHTENTVHLMGVWMMPVTDKIDVGVSAGPSIFSVSQGLPTSISVAEPGPTVSSVVVDDVKKTTVGVNFGVDVTYLVTKRFGVGGLARYTWGSVDLAGASDKLTVGGFQIGGGLRVRF
jgi:Outer membrane protein beta-barrel domain